MLYRYTEWVGGTLPSLVPFPKKRSPRASSTRSKVSGPQQAHQSPHQVQRFSDERHDDDMDGQGRWVHLLRLRHPLLYGWYLKDMAAWNKVCFNVALDDYSYSLSVHCSRVYDHHAWHCSNNRQAAQEGR